MSGLLQCSKQHPYSAALAASTVLGRRIVKVEPRPGSLSTVMSPPMMWQALDPSLPSAAKFAVMHSSVFAQWCGSVRPQPEERSP